MWPDDQKSFWLICLVMALFASVGGVLGYVMRAIDARVKILWWVACVQGASAAFVGIVALFICIEVGLSMRLTGVCVGVFGWIGANASMGVLAKIAFKKLGVDNHEPIKGREDDNGGN